MRGGSELRASLVERAMYRASQFFHALWAALRPLGPEEQEEAQAWLPAGAWPLFAAMPRADQRHSLDVWRHLRSSGYDQPALAQAALLHDCAKSGGGIQLWHRVAVVLLKAFWPQLWKRWVAVQPPRTSWRYPFWAHAHHPDQGAELAAAAGCDPLAVWLIREHQHHLPERSGDPLADSLLRALQAADDDN